MPFIDTINPRTIPPGCVVAFNPEYPEATSHMRRVDEATVYECLKMALASPKQKRVYFRQ
jgi:hypothetical protein